MSRYGSILGGTANAVSCIVQAATPEELVIAANAACGKIFSPLTDPVITSLTLTGAGDGHMFFLEVEGAEGVNAEGGITAQSITIAAFIGADVDALSRALMAVQGTSSIVDVQIAGAAKGQRVMGIVIFGLIRGGQTELLTRVDLSVNDAYVESPYSRTPVLHAHSGGNVAGGFNGGGIGSKSILGFRVGDGLPLGQLTGFRYTWRDLSPPTGPGPFTGAYVNFVVDMLGDGTQYNIFVVDPLADASLVNNTTTLNPDGTSTTTFDAATQCPIIVTPPAVVTVPAHSFGGRDSYRVSDILADYPNAVLREADTGDGGYPITPTNTSPFMIITGDSANNVVRAFLLKNVIFNGATI